MYGSDRISALLLIVLGSCEREHRDAPPPPPVPAPVLRDAVPPLDAPLACTDDHSCPSFSAGATCGYSCVDGRCRFMATVTTSGAGPCYGDKRGGASWFYPVAAPVIFQCDQAAGIYCDLHSHRCAPVQAIGGACFDDLACGENGRCLGAKSDRDDRAGTCAPVPALGASCDDTHCGAHAFCDDHQVCRPRIADGATCEISEECQSEHCEQFRCIPAPTPIGCPVALPAW